MSGYIFATKACIDNRKTNLLSSNISSRCPYNIVNFGPLTAEIDWRVWGTPSCFNGYRVCSDTARQSSSGRQPNFAALNRGRHLYSAEQPLRWASGDILVNHHLASSLLGLVCMSNLKTWLHPLQLECGPMPNVMVALPNTGGALCSTPQSLADAHCSNTVQ